jgi:hypothetical protein
MAWNRILQGVVDSAPDVDEDDDTAKLVRTIMAGARDEGHAVPPSKAQARQSPGSNSSAIA